MSLPTPKLDDRSFQDLVDEAKKRIPHYCEEWTDHNVSDPGVTLIELFAWMTETLLYRLNRVPDLHYIKMMEMFGIRLQPPAPARAPVTFWLSAPQETRVTIPAGTEVASLQTETEPSIVFTTEAPLDIHPPRLTAVLTRAAGEKTYHSHNLRRLQSGIEGVPIFSARPQVDDALYFGFENDLSHHLLGFAMNFDPAGGAGIDPSLPPYRWEVSGGPEGKRWLPCEVERDTTRGMNTAGRIHIHLPRMTPAALGKLRAWWVRVRVDAITPEEERQGMRPYETSPRLRQVQVASWGGTTQAVHARVARDEFIGRSDGSPGQRFRVQHTPLLPREEGEHILVQADGEPPQVWKEVADFSASSAEDRHYTLDSISGKVRFGPAIRQPDGTIKRYGAVPPRGSNLVMRRYRYGGGQEGNLQAHTLTTLKSAIPYIARVDNRAPAWGGLDAESIAAAKMRLPALLRSRERAVTAEDFEFLARQARPASIGRVKCLAAASGAGVPPGQVYVLVVPRLPRPEGYLPPESLQVPAADLDALRAYLDERRLLTTRLEIRPPAYTWVAVEVQLRPAPDADPARVEQAVLERLYAYLNPLTGGPEGQGWPFGREVFLSDVYQCLQNLPGVLFIRGLTMRQAEPGGEGRGKALESVEVVAHGVVASGRHQVVFV